MKKIFFVLSFLFIFMACTNQKIKLSTMQIREMTVKEMNGDYNTTFKSVMSVLQDQDYIIDNTDFNSGLIVASKEANKETTAGDVMMILFVDMRHGKKSKLKISATITEKNKDTTQIRLNIQEIIVQSGTFKSSDDIINVQNKDIYKKLFEQIAIEIERKKATN